MPGSVLSDLDRFKLTLGGFVRTIFNRVDYLAMYPCTVAAQNADGTLELTPDLKTKLGPGFSAVKYKPGIPGVTVTVAAGCRVLIGWENGDPSKPFACGWDQIGTVTKTTVDATDIVINGGTQGAARNTDTVDIGTFAAVGLAFQWTPPGGGAAVTLFTLVPGTGAASLAPGSANGNGKINAGSAHVKIG